MENDSKKYATAEMNIKFNDDDSITINDVRYIPDFWVEAKASAKPEKRHTGIEEPERDDSICYIDGDGILETYDYSSGEFESEYLRGRVTTDEQLAIDRDRAAQIRFALEKYAAEHNAGPLDWTDSNTYKYHIIYAYDVDDLRIRALCSTKHDTVYFDSEQTALDAIKAVGEENVLWLYRDYQPYLNAFKTEV